MAMSSWLASVTSGRISKPDPDAVTAESIERAKQATAAARQRIFETTGVRVTDEGAVIHETRQQ